MRWFRIILIAYTIAYTRAGIGVSISHSREVINLKVTQSRKRWKSYIVILNQSKQGGYSMKIYWCDILFWVMSFEAARAVCRMIGTRCYYWAFFLNCLLFLIQK